MNNVSTIMQPDFNISALESSLVYGRQVTCTITFDPAPRGAAPGVLGRAKRALRSAVLAATVCAGVVAWVLTCASVVAPMLGA